ncbi:MAG: DUF2089 family protein [Gemmataceae bacterium]
MPGVDWWDALDDEDRQFVLRFLLASGSLKELAEGYGISYPTVRGRLDRLIAKVKAVVGAKTDDPFERKLKGWVAEGRLTVGMAKELIAAHRAVHTKGGAS